MSSCLNLNINNEHIPEKKETLWIMMTILIIFTLYYIFVNAKYIKVINKYMPFIGKFVDEYNLDACIKSEGEKKPSVSIIYILLISVYIIIFASIFVYSYMEFGYLFKTLGDGVYVFITMFVFMYVIFDRIYYYDRCFRSPSDSEAQCYTPECAGSNIVYSFSDKKCVKKIPPTTTTPSNTTPSEPTNTTKDNNDDNRGRRGPPGAPGPPGPPGPSSTQIYNSKSLLSSMVKAYNPMLSTKSDNVKNNLRKGLDKLEDDVKLLEEEFNKLEGFKNGSNYDNNDLFLKAYILMDELYELIK